MDTNKELLVANIKDWLKMDAEIGKLKKEIAAKNKLKKKLTDGLMTTMKTNNIDCFDIKDGASLVYKRSKVKKPINAKSLLEALSTYYKDDVETATELTKFVLDRREEEIKETLCLQAPSLDKAQSLDKEKSVEKTKKSAKK